MLLLKACSVEDREAVVIPQLPPDQLEVSGASLLKRTAPFPPDNTVSADQPGSERAEPASTQALLDVPERHVVVILPDVKGHEHPRMGDLPYPVRRRDSGAVCEGAFVAWKRIEERLHKRGQPALDDFQCPS